MFHSESSVHVNILEQSTNNNINIWFPTVESGWLINKQFNLHVKKCTVLFCGLIYNVLVDWVEKNGKAYHLCKM